MSGAYDAGFGDMNAIIQQAAAKPGEQPVMVYMIYNKSPFAIVHKEGTIKSSEGHRGQEADRRRVGDASLFPLFAKLNGLDPAKVEVINIAPSLQEQMLLRGDVDIWRCSPPQVT